MNIWDFKDKHKGLTGVAMGSGPSLALSQIMPATVNKVKVITCGVNDVSKYWDPRYLVSFDSVHPKDRIYDSWVNSRATKFLSGFRKSHGIEVVTIRVNKNTNFKNLWKKPGMVWFVSSISSILLPVQILAYMGCKKIILTGADFGSYNGIRNAWSANQHQNGEGIKLLERFQNPKKVEILRSLSDKVHEHLKTLNIEVFDLSYGDGEILGFPKISKEQALALLNP